ncbi:unnamed protein product, partial [Rotaria magnacalcarata]
DDHIVILFVNCNLFDHLNCLALNLYFCCCCSYTNKYHISDYHNVDFLNEFFYVLLEKIT